MRKTEKPSLLQVGDVFNLVPGMKVYVQLEERFIYQNRPTSHELSTTDVTVGQPQRGAKNRVAFDTNTLCGAYVVVETGVEGGGTGMGEHDVYPDGWHVQAVRLKSGAWDKHGQFVSFYQTGCFTAMNEKVPVVNKMEQVFVPVGVWVI